MLEKIKRFTLVGFMVVVPILGILACIAIVNFKFVNMKYLANVEDFPRFPWPPPSSSAMVMLDTLVDFKTQAKIGDVAQKIERAFTGAGYIEKKYYAVPNGFALVSRLEQIYPDGTPREESVRWVKDYRTPRIFDLKSYLKVLFSTNPGYFRIIVFLVTPVPFGQQGTVSREQGLEWFRTGANVLPNAIADLPNTSDFHCTALIYEWEQKTVNHEPTFLDPSPVRGDIHLVKSKLWENLTR
jgi:hypothetical protein